MLAAEIAFSWETAAWAAGGIVAAAVGGAAGAILSRIRGQAEAREWTKKVDDLERRLRDAARTIEQTKVRHKALTRSLDDHREAEEAMRRQRAADEGIFARCQAELHDQQERLVEVELSLEKLKKDKTRIFAAGRRAYLNWRESERQMHALANQDGMAWQRTPTEPPAFRPLADRRTIIVAAMNLKGGVGKTTIAANLAYALAAKGRRVLLVDLDHQASLTGLCLSSDQIAASRGPDGKLVNDVLEAVAEHDRLAEKNLIAVDGLASGFCLAAAPKLLQLEERLKAQWLLRHDGFDGRFALRAALHSPRVAERFDWILIDCPPRPTAACVNALAAADRILAPTILDKVSAESLPLMLGWLRVLKDNGVCPDLEVLGVVGNCTHWKSRLTRREQDVWIRLQRLSADAWARPVHPFATFIPDKGGFAEAAERRIFAASGKEIGPIFDDLADEAISQMS